MRYSTVKKILRPFFAPNLKEINGAGNLPQKGSYLVAANHVDFLDGFFIATAFELAKGKNIYFLSKTKNYWWTSATLPIDPHDKNKSIEQAVNYLKEGKIICNFIEGKRNGEKYLGEGKTGTARIALLAQVPVVPLGIICPAPKSYSGSVLNLLLRRQKAIINIGQPLTFEEYYGQEITRELLIELTHKIMGKISPLCHKFYSF